MVAAEAFDLVVVGGGKGGKTLAMDLAKQGHKAALIERSREMIGGTCINVACIPTKTLVQSAKVAELVRRAGDYGLGAALSTVNLSAVRNHKRAVVDFMRGGNYQMFTHTPNLEFILGAARFVGERTVAVTLADGATRTLTGTHVIINTGTRPALPPIPGLAAVAPLTNETILELDTLPAHLLVIGGGFQGVEFAQMFRRLGSQVTLLQRGGQLLPREDADVAEAVRQTLEHDGVTVRLGTAVERAESGTQGGARLHLRAADGDSTVEGSHVLAVIGRAPVTADLELAAAGVAVDARGFVVVDEHLATAAPSVWAVGDVNGGPEFTHVSLDDYRIVKAQITGVGAYTSTAQRILAYAVFTDPELGRVGLTEAEARKQGYQVRVARLAANTVGMPRAQTSGETAGFLKAVVDGATDRLLGVAFFVAQGSEMTAVAHLAMRLGAPYTTLRDEMYVHPTFTEGLNGLFGAWVN